MRTVKLHEAKTNLSRLVEEIESGAANEIAIARNGNVVAHLVPVTQRPVEHRLGVAKGQFSLPDSIAGLNQEIEELFS